MKKNNNRFWISLIILFFVGGLFYAIVWQNAPVMEPDSATYMQVATDLQDLKLEHIYGRTPGYPLLLMLTGSADSPQPILFYVQILLYEITIFMMVMFLYKLGLSKKLIIAFTILAMLPYNFVHTAYVLTETLTIFLLIGGFVCLLFWLKDRHWSYLLFAGIALALSAIVKPTYQLISLAAAIVLFVCALLLPTYRRRMLQAAGVLVLTALFFIGGLVLNNRRTLGFSGLTPDFGIYLSTKTPRVLERLPDEYAEVREILIKHRDERLLSVEYSHTGFMYIWGALPEIQQATHLKYPELSEYMLKLNLLLIKKAPLTYLQEVTYSVSNLLLPSTTHLSDFNNRTLQFIWTALHYFTMVLFILVSVFCLGFFFIFIAFPSSAKKKFFQTMREYQMVELLFVVLGMMLVYYTIVISAMSDMGVARHRVPVDLIIFALIAVCIDLWNKLRKTLFSKENLVEKLVVEES